MINRKRSSHGGLLNTLEKDYISPRNDMNAGKANARSIKGAIHSLPISISECEICSP